MMEGTLDEELEKRWAWDRKMPKRGHGEYRPEREWKDLVDKCNDQHSTPQEFDRVVKIPSQAKAKGCTPLGSHMC